MVAVAASVVIHVLLMALVSFPGPGAVDASRDSGVLRQVELPPRVRVPSSPEPIERPPAPEARPVDVDETPVEAGGTPVPTPAPGPTPDPPEISPAGPGDRPSIARADIPPLMEAPDQLRERLRRSYPDRLQRLRRGGVVELEFFIDRKGDVDRVDVTESSGHSDLDRAAVDITGEVTFLPAMIRDRPVGIWVRQRICFIIVDEREEKPTPEECERRVAVSGE